MNQLTSSVTHMVIDKKVPDHFSILKQLKLDPSKVKLQWIVDSMLSGRPLPEADFAYVESNPGPSPRSKIAALRTKRRGSQPEEASEQEQLTMFENDLMSQYNKKTDEGDNTMKAAGEDPDGTIQFKAQPAAPHAGNNSSSQAAETTTSQSMTQVDRFLSGKNLALVGFDEDREGSLSDWVTEAGGELVFRDFA